MSDFLEIEVEMAGGAVRAFVAREGSCWLKLRPVYERIRTSDNIRGNLPLREVPPASGRMWIG